MDRLHSRAGADIENAKRLKTDFRVIDDDVPNQSLGKRPVKKLVTGRFTAGGFTWSPDSRTVAFEESREDSRLGTLDSARHLFLRHSK